MPFSQARSMISNASSCAIPCPKNAGADPTPPKFPQPRRALAKLIAGSFGQVHPCQLVPHVPELGIERMVDQAPHDLDRRSLRADDVGADHPLDDLEVPNAPDD